MSDENPKKNNEFFEKASFFDDILSSNKIINPKRDWIILIVLFFVSLIFIVIFDGLKYYKISNEEMYVNVHPSEIKIETLKKEKIEALINDYESRKETISKMKVGDLVDPSI